MNPSKVELGRRLFYDSRLSVNGKQSCEGDWLNLDEKDRQAFRNQRSHPDAWSGQEALFRAEMAKARELIRKRLSSPVGIRFILSNARSNGDGSNEP